MADNELLVKNWHNKILGECETKLDRSLTDVERTFIMSRRGLLALEAIHDTVKSVGKEQLERYLNSEARNRPILRISKCSKPSGSGN
jgi:hypothetical protein